MPPSLKSKPEEKSEHLWYFDFYNTLSRYRAWNEGVPNPVSLSDVFALLDEFGIYESEYRSFVLKVIGSMDDAYIKHFSEKRKNKMEDLKRKK